MEAAAAAAAAVSFAPYCFYAPKSSPTFTLPFTNRRSIGSLKLRASSVNYPLASKILIKNLPYSASESDLQEEFSSFGEIAEVEVVKDIITNRSKGYAFIQYTSQQDAMVAWENMDQKMFDGRLIHVELSRPGKNSRRSYPIATGPPRKKVIIDQDQEDETDCWY